MVSYLKYLIRLGPRGVSRKYKKCGIQGGALSQTAMSLLKIMLYLKLYLSFFISRSINIWWIIWYKCVENMHISGDIWFKICTKIRIISVHSHFLGGCQRGRGLKRWRYKCYLGVGAKKYQRSSGTPLEWSIVYWVMHRPTAR